LPLRAGTRGEENLAGRIDPHRRTLERADAGALDIATDAEAEVATVCALRALALSERRNAAERGQRLPQRARIITAVVDGMSSARIMLRKRTSAGSSPSSAATRSTMRSIAKAASGRPAPRYGAFGTLLVAAMLASIARASIL
jgi:hypothetical protein